MEDLNASVSNSETLSDPFHETEITAAVIAHCRAIFAGVEFFCPCSTGAMNEACEAKKPAMAAVLKAVDELRKQRVTNTGGQQSVPDTNQRVPPDTCGQRIPDGQVVIWRTKYTTLTASTIQSASRNTMDDAEKTFIHLEDASPLLEDAGTPMSVLAQPTIPEDKRIVRSDIDWSQCAAVQRTTGVVSGQWRVNGTRIPVDALIQNYNAGYSPEELATRIFIGLPLYLAREIIKYAAERS